MWQASLIRTPANVELGPHNPWLLMIACLLKKMFGRSSATIVARAVSQERRFCGTPWSLQIALSAVFVSSAVLRVGLIERHGLWADEAFSLAIATGHSLEHPAAYAEPAQGDYVDAPQAYPPSFYGCYVEHGHPPGGPE